MFNANSKSIVSLVSVSLVVPAILLLSNAVQARKSIPETNFTKTDAALYGRQLVDYSEEYNKGWADEIFRGEMTLFDAEGNSINRTFVRMSYERFKTGDKAIIKFTSPAEIKGVSVLTYENPGSSDDNWLYLPSTKRVRRISGANNTASFQGTEFTYEDLNDLDPAEYSWRFLGESELEIDGKKHAVYRLDAKPSYEDTGYSHVVLYLSQKNWAQLQVDYYDKAGQHLKTRTTSDWKQFHGKFWRAQEIEMINHQSGKRTKLKAQKHIVDVSKYKSVKTGQYRKNLKEDLFTTRKLKS